MYLLSGLCMGYFLIKKIQVIRLYMQSIFSHVKAASVLLFSVGLLCFSLSASAQKSTAASTTAPPVEDTDKVSLLQPVKVKDTSKNSTDQYFTLQQCVDYALQHQPGLNIALINIDVAKTTNAINLSTALPQINVDATLTHYLQQTGPSQTSTANGVTTGYPIHPPAPGYTFFPRV